MIYFFLIIYLNDKLKSKQYLINCLRELNCFESQPEKSVQINYHFNIQCRLSTFNKDGTFVSYNIISFKDLENRSESVFRVSVYAKLCGMCQE